MVAIKLEITQDELVALDATPAEVHHGYDEAFEASVRTYCLEEICAEKLRSTRQTQVKLATRGWARPRARDFYDLWHLVREPTERIDWSKVATVLPAKCAHRRVTIRSVADVFEVGLLEEVRAT